MRLFDAGVVGSLVAAAAGGAVAFAEDASAEVPRKVWVCFFGGRMRGARSAAFERLRANVGLPVHLVTDANLASVVLPGRPLHPAFEHLTLTHKSDYLRFYLMHHFGGGYHDIKPRGAGQAWSEADFAPFRNASIWLNAVHERAPADVAGDRRVKAAWRELAAMSAFVFRPRTPLTAAILARMDALLDRKAAKLAAHPGAGCARIHVPRDGCGASRASRGYPIGWSVLGGAIAHPAEYEFCVAGGQRRIAFTLADWTREADYRGESVD